MGIASTICLPNDPVGTAIISVRHWQSGNCSQPLWGIAAVRGLVGVTTSHRPVFRLSEPLTHRRDAGLVTDREPSLFSPLLCPPTLFLYALRPHSPPTSSPHPFHLLSLFFSSFHKTTQTSWEKSYCCLQEAWSEEKWVLRQSVQRILDQNLCKLGQRSVWNPWWNPREGKIQRDIQEHRKEMPPKTCSIKHYFDCG